MPSKSARMVGGFPPPRCPADWEIVRDRYLGHWTAYAPLPDLRRRADRATQLGDLPQVVRCVGLVSNREPALRWETAGGLAYFVQQWRNRNPPTHF